MIIDELKIDNPTALKAKALAFAKIAHSGQVRKYTGEPYWTHPLAVAKIVESVVPNRTDMYVAALLHDTVEDTIVTDDDIKLFFGDDIAAMVRGLTDVPKGNCNVATTSDSNCDVALNRAARKELDRARLALGTAEIHTIKLADLIHNTPSIVKYDKRFAKIYLKEKEALLDVLVLGDATLMQKARTL